MSIDINALINHEQQRQYLTFRVGDDPYGVATRYVREILEFDQITLVPMMPSPPSAPVGLMMKALSVCTMAAKPLWAEVLMR